MFTFFVGVTLAISFGIFIPGRVDGDELFTLSALMVFAMSAFFVERKRTVNILPLFVFWIYCLGNSFFARTVASYSSVINIFIGVMGMVAIAERIDLNSKWIARFVLAFVIANYIVIGFQLAGVDKVFFPLINEVGGMSLNPWMLGCTLVMALPFLLNIHPSLGLLVIPGLYLSQSSSCIAAAGLAAIVYFWNIKPLRVAFFFLLPLAVGLFIMKDGIDHNRFEVWVNSYQHIKNHWIGNGIGSWAHSAFVHKGSPGGDHWLWEFAHNEYYQAFYELGRIGFPIAMALVFFIAFICAKTQKTRAAICGILAVCFFHPVLHWGKFTFCIVVIVAMALAEYEDEKLCLL